MLGRLRDVPERALQEATRRPLWIVFTLAALIRIVYVLAFSPSPFVLDSAEYVAAGAALVNGQGLIETGGGGPRPPLYVMFVATTYTLGGLHVFQIASAAMGALTAVLIAVLAREIHGQRYAMIAAGLIAAAYPWFVYYVGGLASETLFTLLVVATFVGLLVAARRDIIGGFFVAGILFGLAVLTRSNMMVLGPGLLVWLWWRSRIRAAALFVLGAVIVLTPVTIYHNLQGHGLSVAGTGGGLAFYIGNGPDQTLLYSGTLTDEEWRELNTLEISPTGMAFLGCEAPPCAPLATRDQFYYQAALRYIQTHPAEWATTAAKKLVQAWQPWVEPRAYGRNIVVLSGLSFTAMLVLAVLGLRRARADVVALVFAVALGTTATAVLFLASHRYRFPILDPLIIATAAGPLGLWMASALSWRARRG